MVDEIRTGTEGDDTITTGDGNDLINGLGGTDEINSGAGDDTVNPGDNTFYDFVDTGAGMDQVILSDTSTGFQLVSFGSLSAGVTVAVDGTANTASVDKGANGTTTIVDVQTAMLATGFGIMGSDHNDVFTVTGVADGFAWMRGMGGNDTFNIVSGPGTVRLDYRATSVTTGIVADLEFGDVSEDGFGGTDTITGDRVDDFRGTNLDDRITASNDGGRIRGEAGNDLLIGNIGNDRLDGGDGNDTLNPLDNSDFDEADAGAGDDQIVFSDVFGTDGNFAVSHWSLDAGVSITVDGVANTGSVDKGTNGTTTLIDVQKAMEAGSLSLFGSTHDDVISASASADGDVRIRGYQGNDTIEIVAGPGKVRVDYDSSSVSNGIVANLGTGIVSEDGFGGTDTITGVDRMHELRGSRHADDITGSDGNDRVVLKGGDDTMDGGVGTDRAVFWMNSSDATVTQIGTGDVQVVSSDGTDILRNVEELQFDNETLLVEDLFPSAGRAIDGTSGDDTLEGGGGDDTINGLAGNDRLEGRGGNDVLNGGDGDDILRGGDGDDTLNPGSSSDFDEIDAGAGNDRIEFSDGLTGGFGVAHWSLDSGMTITVDGAANTGTVDKGANGTTTLVGVQNAMQASYFFLFGNSHDDVIRASASDGGDVRLRGYGGNDTLEIVAGPGRVRVDYDSSSVTRGIVADLGTGIVSEDAFGGTDTITGVDLMHELRGTRHADDITGSGGDDRIVLKGGDDTLDGGAGNDGAVFWMNSSDATITQTGTGDVQVVSSDGTDILRNVEMLHFDNETLQVDDLFPSTGGPINGTPGDDVLNGTESNDEINGLDGNDRLVAMGGNDTLNGGDGNDTLNGGDGDDMIIGGATDADLRDVVYGGEGNDSVDAGYGNDLVFGQGGNDTIAGGFGVDELQGQDGDDVITGSAFSDLVFGGAGNDFVNGGFGHDRINGGAGADKVFHVGGTEDQMLGHGSDWVQDYNAAEGDVLLFGDAAATADQFQVNLNHTANSEGERSGDDDVQEAFVIYRPTGQILWALVDGEGQAQINLQIGTEVFDLLG